MSTFRFPSDYALGLSALLRRRFSDGGRLRAPLPRAGLFLLVMVPLLIWLLGARNPFTPAGYVSCLTKGAVFGRSTYHTVFYTPVGPMGVPLTGTFPTMPAAENVTR
jgi:hypothetical protein